MTPRTWAGVDVGGRRKGFHLAWTDGSTVLGLANLHDPTEVAQRLVDLGITLVAIDSPRAPAPDGSRSRRDEVDLARARVCGIRYTPDHAMLQTSDYYEWIRRGLELYRAVDAAKVPAIECFPTASWSRWAGPRVGRRAPWSRAALQRFGLAGVRSTMGQDFRDAIGAALTAKAHTEGGTESFGAIVVPLRSIPPR
jgi:predicted nuclease with RNAse H fold